MTAHVRLATGLVLTLTRDGKEIDRVVATTGEKALKFAIFMIAKLDYLQDGDRLTVKER